MKEKRFGTLQGLTAPILIYESIGEVEAIKPGGVLEECNNNLVYRGPLNDAREIICDWLERKSGVERERVPVLGKDKKPKKNEKGEIITETVLSDGKYAAEVCAKRGWEDLSQFQAELDKVFAELVERQDDGTPRLDAAGQTIPAPLAVDITQRERKPSLPKKLAAKYVEFAKSVLAGTKIEKFIQTCKAEANVDLVLSGDSEKDTEAFGWATKALLDARERKQMLEMKEVMA